MIYTFRFISDEEESFVLDININHNQTFEQMHQAIHQALNFDLSQPASFFISNSEWEKLQEVTNMDMGDDMPVKTMAKTKIEDFYSEKGQHILYVFDFFAERLFFGSLTRTIDAESPVELPSVSRLDGRVPEQVKELLNSDMDFLNALDFADDDIEDEFDNFESLDDLDEEY